MVRSRRQRMVRIIIGLAVVTIAVALVLYALRQNINLYFTPTQLLHHPTQDRQVIRLGGMVAPHSLQEGLDDQLQRNFFVYDGHSKIQVHYHGILPALFHDGQGVIVQGSWHAANQYFSATQVLAKHDARYHPPGVK